MAERQPGRRDQGRDGKQRQADVDDGRRAEPLDEQAGHEAGGRTSRRRASPRPAPPWPRRTPQPTITMGVGTISSTITPCETAPARIADGDGRAPQDRRQVEPRRRGIRGPARRPRPAAGPAAARSRAGRGRRSPRRRRRTGPADRVLGPREDLRPHERGDQPRRQHQGDRDRAPAVRHDLGGGERKELEAGQRGPEEEVSDQQKAEAGLDRRARPAARPAAAKAAPRTKPACRPCRPMNSENGAAAKSPARVETEAGSVASPPRARARAPRARPARASWAARCPGWRWRRGATQSRRAPPAPPGR